jgi:hypothetical protein
MRKRFDDKIIPMEFRVVDLISLRKNDRTTKLDEFKVGPFRIK